MSKTVSEGFAWVGSDWLVCRIGRVGWLDWMVDMAGLSGHINLTVSGQGVGLGCLVHLNSQLGWLVRLVVRLIKMVRSFGHVVE